MYAIPDAPSSTWQFMPLFGGPVVIGVLQVAVMPCILESPIWLLHRRQVDQAHLVMNQLYLPGDDVDSHWSLLVATMERQTQETESSSSKLSLLVSAKYRKQFSIAVVLSTMQQLCGMNALVVYGPTMFKAIGIHELRLSSTIVNFGRFHDMYLGMKFGDRFNRRTLLLVGSAGMIVGSLGFTVCQTYPSATNNWVQITCMLAFVASFCMSVGSLGWIVSTELIPEVLGASSGAIATCCTWTAQFFIGVYFQQISSVGHWGSQAFGIFPAVLVVFVLFVWICVPDTRTQTTDQVTAMFYSDDDNQKQSDDDAFVYWTSDKENCILSSP
ncbi:hypothetical protein AaE_007987 [Aphanomyces astaci]|uniref:Major facilitator superfamily (MFS) profile domain-containing protein n=1 Tax=Aphanomyces astaci TaxID=112090 RepID=A0A6A5AEL1_APHAT|nr:hypothetical protein AaE_007987 [Aphanomyces astaci]